jgi:hypothetical protein
MKVRIVNSHGRRYGKVGQVVEVPDLIGNWLMGHTAAVLVEQSKTPDGGARVREVPPRRPIRLKDKESDE